VRGKIDAAQVRVWVYRMKPRMRSRLTISLAFLVITAAGCSKSDKPEVSPATPQPSASASHSSASLSPAKEAAGDGSFACTLLTREETQAVQGEPFKDAKPSLKSSAGLTFSQCYFELPTTVNSIVLTVTQRAAGADGRDPKQNWQEIFHHDKAAAKNEEKEKEGGEPEKVEEIGDEAFWTGTRVGGALYVLQGNSFIRISIGGAGDRAEKIEKSKALAQSVLKRL
jgi:hypothetical protein